MSTMSVTMRANIVRRRSSSNHSAATLATNRRSSISQKDIDYIQNVLGRTKQVSNQLTVLFFVIAPIIIHLYYPFISTYQGRFSKVFKMRISAFIPPLFKLFPFMVVSTTILFQFLFFWLLPSTVNIYQTAKNERFRQHCNAFSAVLLNSLIFGLGAAFRLYSPTAVFDNWNGIMVVMGLLSLVVVLWQFYTEEEDEDADDALGDLFYGKIAQPILFDMDVKAFLTNRVLTSLCCLYLFSALAKQQFLVGKITPGLISSVSLQILYLLRRAWTDPCKPSSLDNQQDKSGFVRIWGTLVFLPTLYLTPVTLLAQTSKTPTLFASFLIFLFGVTSQLMTYSIDEQRREFRQCDGVMRIDGKDPFYITAKYRREGGEAATNLLLGSGYWGRARHFNYFTELLSFICWTFPLKLNFIVGVFPLLFLALFLYIRACRDELRCLLKYHSYWIQYTNKVRYIFIPNVY